MYCWVFSSKEKCSTVPCLSPAACLRADPWRLIFCSQHQFLFLFIWIVIPVPWPSLPGDPGLYQPNQTSISTKPGPSAHKGHTILIYTCVSVLLMHGNEQNILKLDSNSSRVGHSDRHRWRMECASVCSQSCPFSPNVRASLSRSWLEIVNTRAVGIFHPCERSSPFYFHKMKWDMRASQHS